MHRRAAASFGHYADARLRRFQNAITRNILSQLSKEDHILKSVNHALDDFNRRLVHFPSDPGIKKIECAVGEERPGVCGDVIAIIRRPKDHKKFILFDAKSVGYPIDKMAVAGGSSDHSLQNDEAISIKWMEAVEEYLDKYMPVQQEKSRRG